MSYLISHRRVLLLFVANLAILYIIAKIAYEAWTSSPWFSAVIVRDHPDYTAAQWIANLIYHIVAPVLVCLLLPFVRVLLRTSVEKSRWVYYTVASALLFCCVYCLITALAPLDSLWECGFVFCYNIEEIEKRAPSSYISTSIIAKPPALLSAGAQIPAMANNPQWSLRGLGYRHLQGFLWAAPALMVFLVVSWSIASHLVRDYKTIIGLTAFIPAAEKQERLLTLDGYGSVSVRRPVTHGSSSSSLNATMSPFAHDYTMHERNGVITGHRLTATNADIFLYYAGNYTPPALAMSHDEHSCNDEVTQAYGTQESRGLMGDIEEYMRNSASYSSRYRDDVHSGDTEDTHITQELSAMPHTSSLGDDKRPNFPSNNAGRAYITSYDKISPPFFITSRGQWLLLAIFLLPLSFLFIVSLYVPSLWSNWSSIRIAWSAAIQVSFDPKACLAGNVACPEYAWAWVKTHTFKITKGLVLKLYPSNVFFYAILFVVPLLAIVCRSWEPLQRMLDCRICLPANICDILRLMRGSHMNAAESDSQRGLSITIMSLREVAAIVITTLFLGLFIAYWLFAHNYQHYWPQGQNGGELNWISFPERLCRTAEQTMVALFSLLLFPASRNNAFLTLMGVSYDLALRWCRWLSALFLSAAATHVVAACWWYWQEGMLGLIWEIPHKIWAPLDDFTVPLVQCLCVLMIISSLVGVFLTRKCLSYNLFSFSTQIFFILIPAVLVHANSAWEYLAPGLILWLVDLGVRLHRSHRAVYASTTRYEAMYRRPLPGVPATAIGFPEFAPVITPTLPSHDATYKDSHVNSSLSFSLNSYPSTLRLSPPSTYTSANTTSLTSPQSPLPLAYTLSPPPVSARRCGIEGDLIELRLRAPGFTYLPGQYACVNIAEISLFAFHPVTISSPVHRCVEDEVVLVIKSNGENTWSGRLFAYIWERQYKACLDNHTGDHHGHASTPMQEAREHIMALLPSDRPHYIGFEGNCGIPGVFIPEMYSILDYIPVSLTVSLDGPYGQPPNFMEYDDIVLVGAGMGITSCKPIYESLYLSYIHDYMPKNVNNNTQKALEASSSFTTSPLSPIGSVPAVASLALLASTPNTPQTPVHSAPSSSLSSSSLPIASSFSLGVSAALRKGPSRVHMLALSRDPSLFTYLAPTLPHTPLGPFSTSLISVDTSPRAPTPTTSRMAELSTSGINSIHTESDLSMYGYTNSAHAGASASSRFRSGLLYSGAEVEDPDTPGYIAGVAAHIHRGCVDVPLSVRAFVNNNTSGGLCVDDHHLVANIESRESPHCLDREYRSISAQSLASPPNPVSQTSIASDLPSHTPCVPPRRVLVVACGPTPLTQALEAMSVEEGWSFYKEEFTKDFKT